MNDATRCDVDGCERAVYARGICEAHYQRLKKLGDVQAHKPLRKLPTRDERSDIVGRILAKCTTSPETGCIEWHGFTLESGYGTISWNSRERVVHRAMWTATVGPIPTDDDWTLDHLCLNRRCVNTEHLEVVTRTENSRRGGGLLRAQSLNKARSAQTCKNGHERTTATRDSRGYRYCAQCRAEQWAIRRDSVNGKRRQAYADKRALGLDWSRARLAEPANQ